MVNEDNNVTLVRDALRELGYTTKNGLTVKGQKTPVVAVQRILSTASKHMTGKSGAPDIIITSNTDTDVVVVIECKADPSVHESPNRDIPIKYAVDGALHYARFLSEKFHVIAIATSGETDKALTVSTFIHRKGATDAAELTARSGAVLDHLVSWNDLKDAFTYDPAVKKTRRDDLKAYAGELHEFLRDNAGVSTTEKPLLVAGTLIALQSKDFRDTYMNDEDPDDDTDEDSDDADEDNPASALMKKWHDHIEKRINKARIPSGKKDNLNRVFGVLSVHQTLCTTSEAFPKGPMLDVIDQMNSKVYPLMKVFNEYDLVGEFYGEFLSYSGGDKKDKGIVLTPPHITELFCDIADIKKSDIVVDLCTGTGGFLIAAMSKMLEKCTTDAERNDVRKHRLIGVENDQTMYALAAANMLLRGDGKANLYLGSSMDDATIESVKNHAAGRPNRGMLNPPYSLKTPGMKELDFVKQMLDALGQDGVGVAIVPMSCAIGGNSAEQKLKEQILTDHRLDAVMTMPPELFYPVGTNTCIMVFTAHRPHDEHETWFAKWTDDEHVKTKNKGRVVPQNTPDAWNNKRDEWVKAYRGRKVEKGKSVLKTVTAKDEWLVEAYLDTDYDTITREDLEKVIKDYGLFLLASGAVK